MWVARLASLGLMAAMWGWLVSPSVKRQGVAAAAVFALLETLFTGLVDGAAALPPRHRSATAIQSAMRRSGYTTVEMFFFNVFYYPIGTVWYWNVLQTHYWLRIALFPAWVWIAELLGGGYLLFVWNRRAWDYRHARFSLFDGLIRLDYLPVWILLGVLHDFLFFGVYMKYL